MPALTRLGDGGVFWIVLSLALLLFPKTLSATPVPQEETGWGSPRPVGTAPSFCSSRSKQVEAERTYTHVEVLDREERVRELARINVGENITSTALDSASPRGRGRCPPSHYSGHPLPGRPTP